VGRLGLSFLAGHGCIHVLAHLPDASYVAVLLIGFLLAVHLRSQTAIAFILGLAWAWGHAAYRLADDLSPDLEGQDILVAGHISSLPEINDADVRFILKTTAAEIKVPAKVLLTWYRAEHTPKAGEAWQFVVRLKRRNGFANPGGFDYEGHLFAEGIGATGYVKTDNRNAQLSVARGYFVTRVRAWIAQRMEFAAPSSRMLGVLQGLAIGDTRQMTTEQWDVFAATGTTHLMAISGLHITMVAALVGWLGGALARVPIAQRRGWTSLHGQVIAGGLAALIYCLLAGLSIPTQRTLAMLSLYFVARWFRRQLSVSHALGLALVALLIVDPFAPLSVGAWLSFGAVAVIVVALSGRLVRENASVTFARVQLAVTVGLLPILIAAFGSLSIVSPLANAIAIPLFTIVIVPCVLIGMCGAALSPGIGAVALKLATWILEALWIPLEWLANQPMALWHFSTPSLYALAALCAGGSLLVIPGFWPSRVLAALLCLTPLASVRSGPPPGDYKVSVLDVGQGLAVVVRTHSHTAVYDAGPAFQSGRDAADFAVLPYLHATGARQIDTLLISHSDLDHRGGMLSLLDAFRASQVLLGPSLIDARPDARECVAGEQWTWDEVRFEILHPATGFVGDDNDTSCVLRIEGRGGSVLLTGDIEASAEHFLLTSTLARADIVVVPHHGSRTSSGPEFVRALAPHIAIFSAGYRNRWGLPKADIVDRWRQAGARTFTTAQSGAIEIDIGERLQVTEHRKAARRYWWRT
jgi:competence protein ComEC